jgi:phosphoenolpyruvate-protein kinase (PTS system EI component)
MKQALEIIQQIATEEGIARLPPVGALIETPSAVFAIDEILEICDFISIGTNDLTQFMLAADRNALALIDDYTVLHPSVLRAVHQVIEKATAAEKPVTVCGEAASDPRIACLLVGLGARRLSMSPVSAAQVRYAIRHSSISSLQELAARVLQSHSSASIAGYITEALRETYPEFAANTVSV